MAHQFELGSYNGEPNFLMRSRKGFCWANLPPMLETIVKIPNMSVACEVFALGPDGHFYFKYRTLDETIKQLTSDGFWELVNHKWNGAWLKRMEFGESGVVWGIKRWNEGDKKFQGIFATGVPSTLITKIEELDSAGKVPTYSALQIVALGLGGSWILKVQDTIYNHGADSVLWDFIEHEDRPIVNVKVCPIRRDIFWVELDDGTTYHSLPREWSVSVAHYTGFEHHLDPPPSGTRVQRYRL